MQLGSRAGWPAKTAKMQEYVARQPKSAPMQEFLGTVLLANGDRAGARAAFVAAKAADPHFTKADLALVQLDASERNWDGALKVPEDSWSPAMPGTRRRAFGWATWRQ